MKKSTGIAAAAGAAAAIALLAWAFAPRPIDVEVGVVAKGRFESTIDEDAKTRLRERYVVSAPLAGRLARIALREGDTVEADAVLAIVRPALSPLVDERTLRDQELRVEIAAAQAQRVAAHVEAVRVALQQARNEQQRSEELARQGYVSATKLDGDRLAATAAQKELDAAVEERRVAGHEVEQARAALTAVRDRSASRAFELRAPIAGRVLRVAQPSETAVALGTPLLELGDIARIEIVAELLTTDALKARPGSRVRIDRWGDDALLEGRVRAVEPSGFTKVSALGVEEQRVNVLIDIVSEAAAWRALGDGYRVGVRIVTLSLDDALTVPVSAVFPLPGPEDGATGGMAVFVLEQGRARLVPVRVGARNGTHAWLRDGPEPGTTVLVYPPSTLQDGARVRPRSVRQP